MTKLHGDDIFGITPPEDLQEESCFDEKTAKKLDKLNNQKVKIKKSKWKRFFLILLIIVLCMSIAVFGTFFALRSMGRNSMLEQNDTISVPSIQGVDIQSENNGYDIIYNGTKYTYNKNITTVLFMGVDKRELGNQGGVVGTGGQADALYLAAIDMSTGKVTTFAISREAMVDINLYSESGQFLRTENAQICLAYAYGDGKQTSCENMIRSVQRLFYGVNINSYLSLDLDGINAINNSIGGVDVTMPYDMTINNIAYSEGEKVKLTGTMAERFVRSRSHEVIDANNARMGRQKIYLDAFIKKVIAMTKNDITTPLDIYNTATNYTYTDMSASKVTYLAAELLRKRATSMNIKAVPGTVIDGGDYAEYIIDQKAFYEMFLDVYYNKV